MTIEERTPCGNKIAMTFGLTAAEMRVAGLIAEGNPSGGAPLGPLL